MKKIFGMDPIVKEFLAAVNSQKGPQIYELSVEAARKVLSDAQSGKIAKLSADIEDRSIPCGPKRQAFL